MDNLFFALWRRPGRRARRPEDFRLDPLPSGFGRLVAAVAIIGIAVCLLDQTAVVKGKADGVAVDTYGSSQEGNEK